MKNPTAMNSESIEKGRGIYLANCATCHGSQTSVRIPNAPKFYDSKVREHILTNMTEGVLFYTISKGRGMQMPAWESLLSEEDRWQVINFLRGGIASEMDSMQAQENAPAQEKKGICGPSALIAIAVLPVFARALRQRR